MARVTFKFEDGQPDVVVEKAEEGLSILEISEENDVHLNHNCGGVCACSTCHVYIHQETMIWKKFLIKRKTSLIER